MTDFFVAPAVAFLVTWPVASTVHTENKLFANSTPMGIVLMETSPSVDDCKDPIMAIKAVASGKSLFTPAQAGAHPARITHEARSSGVASAWIPGLRPG